MLTAQQLCKSAACQQILKIEGQHVTCACVRDQQDLVKRELIYIGDCRVDIFDGLWRGVIPIGYVC